MMFPRGFSFPDIYCDTTTNFLKLPGLQRQPELSIIRAKQEPAGETSWPNRNGASRPQPNCRQRLAAKKVSAVELAQDAIGRIERHDGKINAICVRDFARGLDAARAADAARARGETGALLGIPVTVKESYNVAGLPTTWGFVPQKDFVPGEDALSISRVKQAGGVILGKTNVPVGLADWQSYNEIYGTTNNPFDLGRTPGGSSGGSSAALAAGYGAAVAGLRHRRLAARAGVPLRRLCAQADLQHRAAARAHAAAIPADTDGPRSGGDRPDGALGRRSLAAARRDRGTRSAGQWRRLQARAAAAASHRAEEFSRAGDRQRSGIAGGQGHPRHHREAGRQPCQIRRECRAAKSAVAGLRGFVAALYADADGVSRRVLFAGSDRGRAGRGRPVDGRRQEPRPPSGCAA